MSNIVRPTSKTIPFVGPFVKYCPASANKDLYSHENLSTLNLVMQEEFPIS